MKTIIDHDNCDILCSVSDNMAIDMNSGEIHMISSWSDDNEEDQLN